MLFGFHVKKFGNIRRDPNLPGIPFVGFATIFCAVEAYWAHNLIEANALPRRINRTFVVFG